MPDNNRRHPWFAVRATKVEALAERGAYPRVFHAVTLLRLVGKRGRATAPLAFRLDTCAFVSVLPEAWVSSNDLKRTLGRLSSVLPFTTAAGEGSGRLARAVRVQFPMAPKSLYSFDFLVSVNLNSRDYGLIALRDVIRFFEVVSEGEIILDREGRPIEIPNLTLIPRGRRGTRRPST